MTEYDLKESKRSVHELYPVLLDAHGNVIDGFHRLRADPNWKTEKLEHIRTPTQLCLARIVANTHRREVSREEREEQINELAKHLLEDEKLPKEEIIPTIVELTTFTEAYVRMLLSYTYKDVSKIHFRATELRENKTESITVPAGMPEAFDEDPSLSPSKLMGKGTGGATEESEDAPAAGAGRVDESVALSVDKSVGPAPAQLAADYVRGYFARYLRPDEEFLRLYLCDKWSFTERQARAVIEGVKAERTGTVGPPSSTQTETTAGVQPVGKWESDQAPTCRCPMCGRDGADKMKLLANWVEDPEMAQVTLFDFVTGAFKR